jgi:predicted dehydrogenase
MNINRRNFILGSAAAATLAGCATNKVGLRDLKGGKLRAAMIGYGIQMRTALVPQFLGVEKHEGCEKGAGGVDKLVEIVAVCDCDKTRREEGAKQVNEAYKTNSCKAVADFRDVLEDPTIDVVCIATPDHWHAYMCVEAMKHGKDVYCEKPLTFSIDEAKMVIAAQKKYGRVFQTGSMQRSNDEFWTACMIVRNGLIGDVRHVSAHYGYSGRKLGGPSHPVRFFDEPEKAAEEGAPNPDVDWNMWLGPAKYRAYSDKLAPRGVNKFYPMFWRFDDDLGSGYNGDWGAHHLDIAQWGIDMDDSGPYKVVCSDEPHSENLFHGGRRQFGMHMIFKSKKDGSDIDLYHGPFGTWGTVFYGTDGVVAVSRGKIAVWRGTGPVTPTPEVVKGIGDMSFKTEKLVAWFMGQQGYGERYAVGTKVEREANLPAAVAKLGKAFDLEHAKVQLYKSPNQVKNFVECVLSRKPTISPAEVGGRSATLCLLCNMSYQYDTGFDWDPKAMKVAGDNPKHILTKRLDYRGWDIVV